MPAGSPLYHCLDNNSALNLRPAAAPLSHQQPVAFVQAQPARTSLLQEQRERVLASQQEKASPEYKR